MATVKRKKGTIGILTGGGDVPGLNPAIRAVRQWKYEPYLKDGKAVDAVFSVVLRWGRSPKGHP